MLERLTGIVTRSTERLRQRVVGQPGDGRDVRAAGSGLGRAGLAGEQASSSSEEMAANIKQNASNASETERIARQSAKDAEVSGNAVGRAVTARQTIAEKITIVQEIARQTDLLALATPPSRPLVPASSGKGFRGSCFGSPQACRAQPGRSRRNRHALERQRQGCPGSRLHAAEARARHQAHV